jgi:nuclear cap-binding protein subunit 1
MSLGEKHPKRVFVARMIELEVRLSYYDRVKGTIPEALYNTGIMADEAPSSEYAYAATGDIPSLLPPQPRNLS